MPDWLINPTAVGADARPTVDELAFLVGVSVVAGFVVAGIFRITIISRDRSMALPTTLVLLTVLTAVLTLVIGGSVARAFGLVGALSIVRFRTIVEDTRDTAFVIFAVVVGMAVGANYILLACLSSAAVTVVASAMRWGVPAGRLQCSAKLLLCVRMGLGQETAPVIDVLKKYTVDYKAVGAATAKQGAAMEVTYALRLAGAPEAMIPFFAELNSIEGVQSIELKENGRG